jgi:hypothetical protein
MTESMQELGARLRQAWEDWTYEQRDDVVTNRGLSRAVEALLSRLDAQPAKQESASQAWKKWQPSRYDGSDLIGITFEVARLIDEEVSEFAAAYAEQRRLVDAQPEDGKSFEQWWNHNWQGWQHSQGEYLVAQAAWHARDQAHKAEIARVRQQAIDLRQCLRNGLAMCELSSAPDFDSWMMQARALAKEEAPQK